MDDISINETTTAPVSYPLVDMFDDSSATHQLWISGAWGWTYPSDNGTHYWSNRSTGSRPDINGSAQHMVLGNTLDLSSAVHPQIRLRYRAYNNGSVTQLHISQDNGANYSNLYSFPDVSSWSIAQVDLSGYVGGSPVRLRLYSSDAQYYGTPWFDMEDLTITERPPEVTLALTDNQPYQARFRWSRFSDGDFSYYVVKRSSSSGVTLSSTTVATITDIADTSWLQTGLSPYDVYYYKVFVYDTVGVYNSGSNEAQRPSLSVPLLSYPFSNDMESGAGNFLAELPWEITSEVAYSGTHSWSDSPYGNYANSASYSLVMKIDLGGGGAVMPELTFWQQYGFETNADWGYVDVSTDGSSYSPIYYITGSSGNWLKERIDLTPWRGYVIWLRFRVSTNSSSVADGWHIDDIQINETTTAAISYPLVDTFNDSSYTHGLWISSAFNWTSPSDNGTHYWSNQATGSRPDINGTAQYMVMGNTMDLSTATYPQIRLRYRAYNNGSVTYLQISQDNGANYTTLYTFPSMSSWSNAQVDLSAYVGGSPMRLRLYSSDATYYGTPWFDVEDLAITENPTNMAQVNYCKIDQPAYVWLTVGQTSPQIFSRVYEPGITNGVGQGTGLLAQIGRGPDGTFPWNPAAGWTWATATYYGDVANDSMDQYFGTISGGAVGMYDYAFRYSINSGTYWNYADLNGNDIGGNGYNYYEPSQAGNLVVTLEPELTLSATQIELTLPEGQTASRVITIGNDGVGPLFFVAQESTTPPTPTDITWLEVSPASANINSNESRTLTVLINATNLTATNTYNAYVVLLTNDPAYTEVDIPITVHVVPPGSVALSGAVLNVNNQAPEQTVFIEVFSGGSLVTSATAGSDGFYYIFGVASGNYLVRVHSEGYYPEQDSTLIPATGVNFTVHRIPNIIPTSTSVHFYGASSYFNSAPLKVGDVVTAQDEDGIWCGCYTVQVPGHYGFLHVYGDDPLTPGVDEGATAGDNLTFRINGNYAHTLGPDTPVWTSDGDTRHVELSADLIRTDMLFLDASWNLISFNMMPDCTDIRIVLQPIISPSDSNVIRVSGFDMSWGGARTYDPRLPEFSDLWDMDPTHGYWLKTVHTDTLAVFGDHYWSDNPMPLDVGWNLSSYLPEETREVERALCSIEGLFAFVSGFDQGAQTYVPGSPFNDLDSLGNGFGYWIKMNYAGTLTYDPTGGCPGSVDGLNQSQPPLALDDPNSVRPTTRWDDYYGDITIAGQPLAVGEIIQAFDRYGNLCGEATIRIAGKYGFLHVYGDDPATSDVEGPTDNQPVQFMWHGQQLGVAWQNDQAWQGQRRTVRLDLNLDLTPTNTWCDFYSSNSMLQTIPVPLGSVIEAYDPQGVQCGRFVVHTAGYYGYLHVYGDDPTTPGIDEGAMPGDTITFSINNGTTIKSINPAWVTGQPGDFFQVNLYGSGYLLPVIDVVISIDQTDIHLDWSAPRYPVDRYVIYRGMNPDFSLTPADSIGYSTTEHYVDPSILETTPNAFYKIKVVGGQ